MFNLEVVFASRILDELQRLGDRRFLRLSVLTTNMCMCGLLSLSYSLWRECVGWGALLRLRDEVVDLGLVAHSANNFCSHNSLLQAPS